MRRSIVAITLAVLFGSLAPSAGAGPVAKPINACIAQTPTGVCKSSVFNTDGPTPGGTNPQVQTKLVRAGFGTAFFIYLHNPNPTAQRVSVKGTPSEGRFTVFYTRGPHNVTAQVLACGVITVGAEATALVVMHVHVNSYDPPPPIWQLNFKVTDAACENDIDAVWARVMDPTA